MEISRPIIDFCVPHLKHLCLIDSWSDIGRFQAPNVQRPMLRSGTVNFVPIQLALENVFVHPKLLDVDLKKHGGLNEKWLRDLYFEKWKDVESCTLGKIDYSATRSVFSE
jgi:hypothetical protein